MTLASLLAVLGVGVGGNLPVDSAVFLGTQKRLVTLEIALTRKSDFVPGSHQYLLTVLSIWWSLGQLFVNLVRSPASYSHTCANIARRSPGP